MTAGWITTKAWTTQEGRKRAGTRIDKKYLHSLLRNQIYLGELSLKGSWHPGAHKAIIDRGLWDQVYAVLTTDPHARATRTRVRSRMDSLLRGLLFAPSGDPMYTTYTRKKDGHRYQYYISKSAMRFGTAGKKYFRLPAADIDTAVSSQICSVLSSPESIQSVVRHLQSTGAAVDESATVVAMRRLGNVWDDLFPAERHRIARLMIERVDLISSEHTQGIRVAWRELGWNQLIREFAPDGIGAELLEVEA